MIRAVQLTLEEARLGRTQIVAEVVMLPAAMSGYTCGARVKIGNAKIECKFFALPSDNVAQCLYNSLRVLPCHRYSNGKKIGKRTGWMAYLDIMPYWITSSCPPEIVKDFSISAQSTLKSLKQSTLNPLG